MSASRHDPRPGPLSLLTYAVNSVVASRWRAHWAEVEMAAFIMGDVQREAEAIAGRQEWERGNRTARPR